MDSRSRFLMQRRRNQYRRDREVESLDRVSRYVDDEGRTLDFQDYINGYPTGYELMSKFYIVDDDSNLVEAFIAESNLERDSRIVLVYKLPPTTTPTTLHGNYSEAGKVMSIKLSQHEFERTSSAPAKLQQKTRRLERLTCTDLLIPL